MPPGVVKHDLIESPSFLHGTDPFRDPSVADDTLEREGPLAGSVRTRLKPHVALELETHPIVGFDELDLLPRLGRVEEESGTIVSK